jgi:hypothetical protein
VRGHMVVHIGGGIVRLEYDSQEGTVGASYGNHTVGMCAVVINRIAGVHNVGVLT